MKQAKIEDEAEWNKLAGTYDETDFHHGNALIFSCFGKAILYIS